MFCYSIKTLDKNNNFSTGPLQRKLDDMKITELRCHPSDTEVLSQGSKFKDRTFISTKSERTAICNLLTGVSDMNQFLTGGEISSENGLLIKDLILHINENWPLRIPDAYQNFIADCSKGSPAAGLLQVTSSLPLKLLMRFVKCNLNIQDASEITNSQILHQSFPTLFPQLMEICRLEKADYLPDCVNSIIKKLIVIRQNTFDLAPKRYKEQYFEYTKAKDDPTQFYPVHKLFRYPKRHSVSGKIDEHCEKNFPATKDFSGGIFVIGMFFIIYFPLLFRSLIFAFMK